MARSHWTKPELFDAAATFVDRCLRQERSLFAPEKRIWTSELVAEVEPRLGAESLDPTLSFVQKIVLQLEGASESAWQLSAEMLYVILLSEHDTGAAVKLKHVQAVLDHVPGVTVPEDLASALGTGIAGYAQVKTRRDYFVRYFTEFLRRWTAETAEARAHLLAGPVAISSIRGRDAAKLGAGPRRGAPSLGVS